MVKSWIPAFAGMTGFGGSKPMTIGIARGDGGAAARK
jgi:hypothetical protein